MVQELLNGLLNWVMNVLINILMNIIIKPIVTLAYNIVLSIVSYYLYQISICLLSIVDLISDIFQMIAGLKPGLKIDGYAGDSNDVIIQVITHEDVIKAFMAMLAAGIFLMIVCTLMASIKQEFNMQKSNKKGEVLNKFFKACFNMVFVPGICIMGVIISNLFLKAIDAATGGEDTTISGRIFAAAATEAKYKSGEMQVSLGNPGDCAVSGSINSLINLVNEFLAKFDKSKVDDDSTAGGGAGNFTSVLKLYEKGALTDKSSAGCRVYYNTRQVSIDMNPIRINYLLIYFSSIVIIKCLFQASFGLVSRFYKIIALFILSPGVVGISPLDDGGAYKSWKKEFVKQVIAAYGVVIAVNLYLILMGILCNISLKYTYSKLPTGTNPTTLVASTMSTILTNSYFADALLKIIFIVVGALMLDKFAATISSIIGSENLASIGKGLSGEVGKTATKTAKQGVSLGLAGTALTYKAGLNLYKGGVGLVKSLPSRIQDRKDKKATKEADKAAKKDAYDAFMKEQADNNVSEKDAKKAWKQQQSSFAHSERKQKRYYKKTAKKAIKAQTGGLAGRFKGVLSPSSRGAARRELMSQAMKGYKYQDGVGKKDFKGFDASQDQDFQTLAGNYNGLRDEEFSQNLKVGLTLGKNAIKSMIPGSGIFKEAQDDVKKQRDKMKSNSSMDEAIIKAYEEFLKSGDEEEAKELNKNMIERANMMFKTAFADSIESATEELKNSALTQSAEADRDVAMYEEMGLDPTGLLEDLVKNLGISGISHYDDVKDFKKQIDARIEIEFDTSKIKASLEELRKSSNSKEMMNIIKDMVSDSSKNPAMVRKIEEVMEKIKAEATAKK